MGPVSENEREIKGARLIKCLEGQRAVLVLFRELGALGCLPQFVLAEKRYCVAAKIVETFLDPYYNPLLKQEFYDSLLWLIEHSIQMDYVSRCLLSVGPYHLDFIRV